MENFDFKKFCDRFNSLIDKDKGSQLKLSKEMNLSQPVISKLKKGIGQSPSADTIVTIAQYFNVSTDWLLGISDIKQLTNDAKELYRQLSLVFMVIKDLENAARDYDNKIRYIAQEFEKKF